MPTTRIFDLASDILSVVQEIFAAEGIDLPIRQYVNGGLEAYDCDQAVVSVTRIYSGLPTREDEGLIHGVKPYMSSVEFRITVLRTVCVMDASSEPPSIDEMNSDALRLMTDGWVLFDGLRARQAAGTLIDACTSVSVNPLTPVNNQGGLGGWQTTIAVQL